MKIFLKILLLVVDLLAFLSFSALIGLWWMPEFVRGTQGGINGSLLRAVGSLVIAGMLFHKHVWVLSRYHTPFHFYFYTGLALFAVVGFLYGIVCYWI